MPLAPAQRTVTCIAHPRPSEALPLNLLSHLPTSPVRVSPKTFNSLAVLHPPHNPRPYLRKHRRLARREVAARVRAHAGGAGGQAERGGLDGDQRDGEGERGAALPAQPAPARRLRHGHAPPAAGPRRQRVGLVRRVRRVPDRRRRRRRREPRRGERERREHRRVSERGCLVLVVGGGGGRRRRRSSSSIAELGLVEG